MIPSIVRKLAAEIPRTPIGFHMVFRSLQRPLVFLCIPVRTLLAHTLLVKPRPVIASTRFLHVRTKSKVETQTHTRKFKKSRRIRPLPVETSAENSTPPPSTPPPGVNEYALDFIAHGFFVVLLIAAIFTQFLLFYIEWLDNFFDRHR